jgi:hypothetical protein
MAAGRTRFGLLVLALMAGTALSSCCPPAPPGTAAPVAGCYDNDTFIIADYRYTGVPNVLGNMIIHGSSDGSCSGPTFPEQNRTLILATSAQSAAEICTELGGSSEPAGKWFDAGYRAMPADNGYFCEARVAP